MNAPHCSVEENFFLVELNFVYFIIHVPPSVSQYGLSNVSHQFNAACQCKLTVGLRM